MNEKRNYRSNEALTVAANVGKFTACMGKIGVVAPKGLEKLDNSDVSVKHCVSK